MADVVPRCRQRVEAAGMSACVSDVQKTIATERPLRAGEDALQHPRNKIRRELHQQPHTEIPQRPLKIGVSETVEAPGRTSREAPAAGAARSIQGHDDRRLLWCVL